MPFAPPTSRPTNTGATTAELEFEARGDRAQPQRVRVKPHSVTGVAVNADVYLTVFFYQAHYLLTTRLIPYCLLLTVFLYQAYGCTTAPLHQRTTAPLHHCTIALLHHRTTAPPYDRTTAPLHHYTTGPPHCLRILCFIAYMTIGCCGSAAHSVCSRVISIPTCLLRQPQRSHACRRSGCRHFTGDICVVVILLIGPCGRPSFHFVEMGRETAIGARAEARPRQKESRSSELISPTCSTLEL